MLQLERWEDGLSLMNKTLLITIFSTLLFSICAEANYARYDTATKRIKHWSVVPFTSLPEPNEGDVKLAIERLPDQNPENVVLSDDLKSVSVIDKPIDIKENKRRLDRKEALDKLIGLGFTKKDLEALFGK